MGSLRFISFFAGIGGGDIGMEAAGHQCVGQIENDPVCRKVLSHHWPGLLIDGHADGLFVGKGDIEGVHGSELPAADAYIISDPCQRNSLANTRIKDGRTSPSLWGDAYTVIHARPPQFVIRENPTRIRKDAPSPPEVVAECLERIGYECCIVDMQGGEVSGVSRQRTFVCAGLGPAGKRLCELLARDRCAKRVWPKIGSPQIPFRALTRHPYRYDNRDNFVAYRDGRVRVLSRAERLRAQGFPEDWLACLGDPSLMRVAQLTGNAWPTFIAEYIGKLLYTASDATREGR